MLDSRLNCRPRFESFRQVVVAMNDQLDLLDDAASIKERDIALAVVVQNSGDDWMDFAMRAIVRLPIGWTGLGEDVREHVINAVGGPHHPNAWGALIMSALRQQLLFKTGQWKKMRAKKSHARMSPVLVRYDP